MIWENADIIITGGVGLATTVISSWSSWALARRKYNAEVDSTKIENLAKIIDV
jgi:predicted RNase H-like nuclease (RuvC/YqgF family)